MPLNSEIYQRAMRGGHALKCVYAVTATNQLRKEIPMDCELWAAGLKVNCSIVFSCLKMIFAYNAWCSLRLLKIKTAGQTI